MLFLFMITGLSSQEYRVSGEVHFNGKPLADVLVRAENTSRFTQTGADGSYTLLLPEGKYTLIFSYGNKKEVRISLNEDLEININMAEAEEVLDEVFLSAVRVSEDAPVTFSNLGSEEIADRNLGQDIPSLMKFMPSVTTTSDAGAGIGYTGIRVRGSDATRVNVTINGVPYNDAESQGTFWVNLGDFASSVESLQLQRGVGTSTNGAGAFGASLNILTDSYNPEPFAEISASVGSYSTRKNTLEFSTGLLKDRWAFSGRASVIKSDGYIDRASSDLKSYFLQGTHVGENSLIKALVFGGSEVTYQAWDGIDAETLKKNRRFNPAGAYEDEEGNLRFYEDHTDNYMQDHVQLLWNQDYNRRWSSNLALHYTYGRGYYESFREDSELEAYGLTAFLSEGQMVSTSDLVTRKWLDNDFYGTTFSLSYEEETLEVIFGGGWNNYVGDHFGEIVYASFAPLTRPFQRYYENQAEKSDSNLFGKATLQLGDRLALYGDLQVRRIHYQVDGVQEEEVPFVVDDAHTFFNPKAGLTFTINPLHQLYFSFARAHREPNRTDYQNGNPEPEELNDFELGWRYSSPGFELNTNLYYMKYRNQLVLTGELNDVGAPIRRNSGNSYRLGLEVDARLRLSPDLWWRPNIALSRNKNAEWIAPWNGELRNFGSTDISYSPEIITGSILEYAPISGLELKWLSKYLGAQYLSNLQNIGSRLDSYFVNDFNIQYTWRNPPLFEQVVFTGLVNNVFSVEYVSNGYYYTYDIPDPDQPAGVRTVEGAGYYPQATRNFLMGASFRF